jgi:hypothetical protein
VQKRAWGVSQVVEHLLSKCEALSSNRSSTKKKKKKDHLIFVFNESKENKDFYSAYRNV